MMFSLFCLYIAAIVLPANANSLPEKPVDFAVFQKKLLDVQCRISKIRQSKWLFVDGCSSAAEEKKENDRECPKDWKKFSRNCYKLLSDKRAWNSGKSACKTLRANLADIISESENLWLYKTFTGLKHFAWIDASDKAKKGKWRWSSYARGGKLHWSVTTCGVHQLQTLCKKKR